MRFRIPLGFAVRIDADTDCPWRTILFVWTLHHLETLDDGARHGVIRNGLLSSLDIAIRTGLRTLATTPMKGGWRLSTPEAYRTMYAAWFGSPLHRSGGSLLVCCRDEAEYQGLVTEHRHVQSTRLA